MTFFGTIISHDPSLHSGLILPTGESQAISFTEGDVLNWDRRSPLLGQKVSFDAVQTQVGIVAVTIMILSTKRNAIVNREYLSAISGPLAVALATAILHRCTAASWIVSYIVAVNSVQLIFLLLISSTQRTIKVRPAEVAALLMAFAGGAPVMLITRRLIPTRFYSDQMAFLFMAAIAGHVLALKRCYPEVFKAASWRILMP